jgi:predicted enzyme related to lactoylglutathione lyase
MFCWIELATSDQAAAKNFYTSLFGWTADDNPMGPGQFYTMWRLNGKDIGGGYTLFPDQVAVGVPPNWLPYVAVQSTDAALEKVKQLGGNVIAGPIDVQEYGRMGILSDPTGAVLAVWQAKQQQGIGVAGADGSFSWADLRTKDLAKASEFYKALFGWEFIKGENDSESDYLHIKNGEHFIGGVPPVRHNPPDAPPHWLVYFHASDCNAMSAKAKQLGADVCFGPITMENVGTYAVVADPQGAYFALFQPGRKA